MSLSTEFKVGLFTLIGAGVLGSTAVVLEGSKFINKRQSFFIQVPNANGVAERTQVRVSGVKVGEVRSVEISPVGAKIKIDIEPNVIISNGSYVVIKSRGVLGDVYIEIQRSEKGNTPLPDGSLLPVSSDSEDIQALVTGLNKIVKDVKLISGNLAEVLGSKKGGESLQNILDNIEGITADLRDVTGSQKQNMKEAIQAIRDSAVNISKLITRNETKISKIIDNVEDFTQKLKEIATEENKDKLQKIIDNVDDMTAGLKRLVAKVERGEGTVGQLLTKDETADEIKKTIRDIQLVIKPLTKLNVTITDRAELRFANAEKGDQFANEFNVLFSTRPDRYYLLGLANAAYGRKVTETITTTTRSGAGTIVTVEENKPEDTGLFRYNAQISQRFGPVAVRLGLFASSGGFATDVYFLDDKFVGTVEVSHFEGAPTGTDERYGKRGLFNLKIYGNLFLTPNLFFTAGVDGFVLNKDPFPFMGAGFALTDDDIKGLIAPAMSLGQ